jgi:hypothetical protein
MFAAAGFVDGLVDDPLGGVAYFGLSDVEVVHARLRLLNRPGWGSALTVGKRQARTSPRDVPCFGELAREPQSRPGRPEQ